MAFRWMTPAMRGGGAAGAAVAAASAGHTVYPERAVRFGPPPALDQPPARTSSQRAPFNEDSDDSDSDPWMLVNEAGEVVHPFRQIPPQDNEIDNAMSGAMSLVNNRITRNDNMHFEIAPTPLGPPPFASSPHSSDDEMDILEINTAHPNRYMESAESSLQQPTRMRQVHHANAQFMSIVATLVRDQQFIDAFQNNPEVGRLFKDLRLQRQLPEHPTPAAYPTVGHFPEPRSPRSHANVSEASPWEELEIKLKAALKGTSDGVQTGWKKLAEACRKAWDRLTTPEYAPGGQSQTSMRGVSTTSAVCAHLFVTASGEVQVLLNVVEPGGAGGETAEEEDVDESQKLMDAVIAFSIMVLAIILFKRFKI